MNVLLFLGLLGISLTIVQLRWVLNESGFGC